MATYLKQCSKCQTEYEQRAGKHGSMCRPCKSERDRAYRARTANAGTRKYEKTPKGFVMRTYRNMESRVTGIQLAKRHLYQGLELLDRAEFYRWSLTDPDFIFLFDNWTTAGWPQTLTPSIDRIDPKRGYVLGNVRWITNSENSRLGGLNRAS